MLLDAMMQEDEYCGNNAKLKKLIG